MQPSTLDMARLSPVCIRILRNHNTATPEEYSGWWGGLRKFPEFTSIAAE